MMKAPITALILCALAASASAGPFDQFTKALDTAKQLSERLPAPPAPAEEDGTDGTRHGGPRHHMNDGSAVALPFDFEPYPRAKLTQQFVNPFDRLRMPASIPIHAGDEYISRYSVPMEGKVTILLYRHPGNDSPLLIREFYEAWLAQHGFERLVLCVSPCKGASQGYDWRNMLDPAENISSSGLPDEGTYIAGYKENAMAVVGIGRYNSSEYASALKIVQGKVIDPQPWLAALTPKTPPPPVPLAHPVATPDNLPPVDGAPVEIVPAAELTARLAALKGPVTVQFSSYDAGCKYCVAANPVFDQLAQRHKGKVTFLRVMFQPWRSVGQDPAAQMYGISAIPSTLTFKNGQLARRTDGSWAMPVMEKQLLNGVL
jgi:thiol-disulfide isomerase/thioredoxin